MTKKSANSSLNLVYLQVKCAIVRTDNYDTFGTNKLNKCRRLGFVYQIGWMCVANRHFQMAIYKSRFLVFIRLNFKLNRTQHGYLLSLPWLSHPPFEIRNKGNGIFRMQLICFKAWYECLTYFPSGKFLNWLCRFLLRQSKLCSMIAQLLNKIFEFCTQQNCTPIFLTRT